MHVQEYARVSDPSDVEENSVVPEFDTGSGNNECLRTSIAGSPSRLLSQAVMSWDFREDSAIW